MFRRFRDGVSVATGRHVRVEKRSREGTLEWLWNANRKGLCNEMVAEETKNISSS